MLAQPLQYDSGVAAVELGALPELDDELFAVECDGLSPSIGGDGGGAGRLFSCSNSSCSVAVMKSGLRVVCCCSSFKMS